MKKKNRSHYVLLSLNRYLVFFLLIAVLITCCMIPFLNIMSHTMSITLTSENISSAAVLTFGIVMLLSLLISVIDGIRRNFSVNRPVKKITDAAEKIMAGDFSVRIAPIKSLDAENKFSEIITCFNKMAEELSGIETLRTDFIANVSHELKTPLAVMQNYGTLLQQQALSEEKRLEYAKAITNTSCRLADLISNILKLNKLENQLIFSQMKAYNLGEQLCECFLTFEKFFEEKTFDIETDIAEDIFIYSDAEMMGIVWNNLFSNAIKFTEPGGKLSLSLTAEGDLAVVKISDTGCGISKEVGAHMFDKFYQGDTSHSAQGNGLGLALVKRIMDITESEIAVESEIGKGSTFTVRMRRMINEETQRSTD